EDVLAYMAFPREHSRQLHSTNPLERLMREIGRRSDVVGIFPDRASLIRLAGAILMEQQDEWIAAPRRYFNRTPESHQSDLQGVGAAEGTADVLEYHPALNRLSESL